MKTYSDVELQMAILDIGQIGALTYVVFVVIRTAFETHNIAMKRMVVDATWND